MSQPPPAFRHASLVTFGVTCLLVTGCATIVHHAPKSAGGPGMQAIAVTSEPAGAQIFVGKSQVGVTPARIVVKRRETNTVLRFEMPGYVSTEVPLTRTTSGAVAGNISFGLFALAPEGFADNPPSSAARAGQALLFPLLGVAVDFMTGAAFELPSQVHVTLKASSSQRR